MTILDMLDQLEAEIVELRARNTELERLSTGAETKRRAKPTRPAKRAQSKGPVSKAKTQRAKKAPSNGTLPLLADQMPQPEKPSIGKRQALGRSIIQLRRHSTNPSAKED